MKDFYIELKKHRRINGTLTVKDSYDAGQTALSYIESLAFLVGNLDSESIQDTDSESLRSYLKNTGELITQFMSVTAGHLEEIEERRKDLQRFADFMSEKSSKEETEKLIERLREENR